MTKPTINIRPMMADDVAVCAAWVDGHELFRPYGMTAAKLAPSLGQALQRNENLLVAENGAMGDLVGLAWFLTWGTFYSGGYLRLLLVAPEATGYGVGSRLMTDTEAAVFQRTRDLFLLVNTDNKGAQKFYEARGYSRIGRIDGYVAPGVHEYIYHKRRLPR